MIRQYIELGDNGWYIYVYYNVRDIDIPELSNKLYDAGCNKRSIKRALKTITSSKNSAFTFTNTNLRTSIVAIGDTNSSDQLVNSAVHEAKHVQSHICEYFNIDEGSEKAAYLIGYIVQQMYRMLQMI